MKTSSNFAAVAFAAFSLTSVAFSQSPPEMTYSASTSQPEISNVQPAAPPIRTIYSSRLPTAQELTNDAAAQHLTIDRIDQTGAQVTVVYKDTLGQTTTTTYQLLPPASTTGSSVTVPTTPAPTVVYVPAPRVVYYDYAPYYYGPWYSYPRVSLGIGFGLGFRGGFHHGGGFHGGFHHSRR